MWCKGEGLGHPWDNLKLMKCTHFSDSFFYPYLWPWIVCRLSKGGSSWTGFTWPHNIIRVGGSLHQAVHGQNHHCSVWWAKWRREEGWESLREERNRQADTSTSHFKRFIIVIKCFCDGIEKLVVKITTRLSMHQTSVWNSKSRLVE